MENAKQDSTVFFTWGRITKDRSLNIYQYSKTCIHWNSVTEQRNNNMFAYTNDISVFVFIQSGIIFHASTILYKDYNIIQIII